MQSERSTLISHLMLEFYCLLFLGKITQKWLTFLVASILLTGSNIGISYVTSIYISAAKATVIDLNKGKSYSETDPDRSQEKGELHLIETTPSGRTYIWKNAIKMGSAKPLFGYGVRNVPITIQSTLVNLKFRIRWLVGTSTIYL